MKRLNRNLEDTKEIQIELLEMKTIISEMKNIVDWINSRLHIGEEKLSGIEDLVRETIQKERQKKKRLQKLKRTSFVLL